MSPIGPAKGPGTSSRAGLGVKALGCPRPGPLAVGCRPPLAGDGSMVMIADTGAGLYACKASVDLFGLTRDDFIDQVKDIITVGEFYDLAAGGQIIFT